MKLRVSSVPPSAGCSKATKQQMPHGPLHQPPGGACTKSPVVIRDSEEDERARPQVMCKKEYGTTPIGTSRSGEPVVGFAVLTNGNVVLTTRGGGEFVATREDVAALRPEFCLNNYIDSCRIAIALNKLYGDIDLLGTGLLIMRDLNVIMELIFWGHRAVSLLPRTSTTPKTWPRDRNSFYGATISLHPHDPEFCVIFGESWHNRHVFFSEFPGHGKATDEVHLQVTFTFPSMRERDVAIEFLVTNGALIVCT
ncbi:hypothetical protein Pelo_8407 [Pelomyxa schiedti]|nr:hypothetical protein Pelo_8407 [Pelomyxa schiedti]